MKTRSQLVSGLVLVFFFILGCILPPARAASNVLPPEELEMTWQITASANRSWLSQSTREKDGKVIARYEGNDSFSLHLAGTTVLTNTTGAWSQTPYFEPVSNNNVYSRSCQGGGTSTDWYLNELTKWDPIKGNKTKEFEATTVNNWQYHWPKIGHPDAGDNPIDWFKLILPQSEKEPLRYQMCLEPFFFIDYDTADEYFETSGTYQSIWNDWEGGGSRSGELGNHAGYNAPSLANQAWHDRIETHPDGSLHRSELTFSDGQFRDKGTIRHTLSDEFGQAFIEITFEINRKPGIKAIQPNQALGRYAYRDKDDYDPATHFVAGKDTVVQVFLPDEVKIGEVSNLELDIYRNGSKIATLTNPKKDKDNNAGIFIPRDRSACDWAAGTYKFVARLDDSEKTLDGVQFRKQRDYRILAVPVKANFGGRIVEPGGNGINGDSLLRKLYPLADDNVKWILSGKTADASRPAADLMGSEGLVALRWELQKLQPHKYEGTPYDAIIGFIAEPIPVVNNNNQVEGYALGQGKKPIATVALYEDYETTVAHEIAHFFGVGDEYNSGSGGIGRFNLALNPPPFGFKGEDLFTFQPVTSPAQEVKPAPFGSGSLISKDLHPYDVARSKLLPDSISFMGSDALPAQYWTSPAIWQHLYNSLGAADPVLQQHTASVSPTGLVLAASGWVDNTGQLHLLDPWFTYPTNVSIPLENGSYSIRAIDGNGEILASQGFTPWSLGIPGSATAWFDVDVPLPSNTSQLEILAGETVVQTIPVSLYPPTDLTILSPAGGGEVSGLAAITWTAKDPDGDSLYYKVEYSSDGQNWLVLSSSTTENRLVQDFSTLPGGSQAYLRVTATDGINTARAVSDAFSVPVKAPQVYLQSPASGASLAAAEGVLLDGRAYDPQEGWLYDTASLVWTSNKDGELGRGSLVYVDNLSPGTHVITLRATSPTTAQTASESIQLTITGDNGTGGDTPQDLGTETNVPLDKRWTVKFSAPVNPITITGNNIRVTNAVGSLVNVEVRPGEDGQSALILPPPGDYLPGQSYTITVGKGVSSATGQPLKSSYMKRFSTVNAD